MMGCAGGGRCWTNNALRSFSLRWSNYCFLRHLEESFSTALDSLRILLVALGGLTAANARWSFSCRHGPIKKRLKPPFSFVRLVGLSAVRRGGEKQNSSRFSSRARGAPRCIGAQRGRQTDSVTPMTMTPPFVIGVYIGSSAYCINSILRHHQRTVSTRQATTAYTFVLYELYFFVTSSTFSTSSFNTDRYTQ